VTGIAPGWYKDPADPATQRYWDGEGWIGHALPAEVEPPPGPPPAEETPGPVEDAPGPVEDAPPAGPGRPADGTGPLPNGVGEAPAASVPPVSVPPAPAPPAGADSPAPGVPPAGADGPGPGVPGAGPGAPGAGAPGWPYPPYRYPARQPPPRPHGLMLASPGARLVARIIDIGVLAVLNLVVNGWFLWQYAVEIAPAFEAWQSYLTRQTTEVPDQGSARAGYLRIVIILITAALWLAYEVPAVANTGQTLGKRVLGIRVVRVEEAGPIGFGRSLRRWNTLGLPTLLWPCCGIGFVLQFVDAVYLLADRPLMQSLHDKSARTVVVRLAGPVPAEATPPGPTGGDDKTDNSGGTA
jgi:uncharacterized RDD family membrane protein YckC